MRAFRMEFEQVKRLPGLDGEIVVRGTIHGKAEAEGVALRIEADAPRPSSILLTPKEVRIYSPDERQLERADLEGAPAFAGLFRGIFLFYAASRPEIERELRVAVRSEPAGPSAAGRTVEVLPREGAWKGLSGPLVLAWEGSPPRLARLAYDTSDGESYRWTFRAFQALKRPEERWFVLEAPPGTPVVDLTGVGDR